MNCLKCGREVPEGQLFCQSCKQPPTVMPAAPIMTQKARDAAVPPKKKKKKKKKFDFARALRRYRIALLVFAALFVLLSALVALEVNDYLGRKEYLRQREANVTLREKEADNRDARIEELEKANAELEKRLQTARDTITLLESQKGLDRR